MRVLLINFDSKLDHSQSGPHLSRKWETITPDDVRTTRSPRPINFCLKLFYCRQGRGTRHGNKIYLSTWRDDPVPLLDNVSLTFYLFWVRNDGEVVVGGRGYFTSALVLMYDRGPSISSLLSDFSSSHEDTDNLMTKVIPSKSHSEQKHPLSIPVLVSICLVNRNCTWGTCRNGLEDLYSSPSYSSREMYGYTSPYYTETAPNFLKSIGQKFV